MAADALPDPIGDEDSPWYWHGEFHTPEQTTVMDYHDILTRTRRVLGSSKMTLAFILDVDPASDGSILYCRLFCIVITSGTSLDSTQQ